MRRSAQQTRTIVEIRDANARAIIGNAHSITHPTRRRASGRASFLQSLKFTPRMEMRTTKCLLRKFERRSRKRVLRNC